LGINPLKPRSQRAPTGSHLPGSLPYTPVAAPGSKDPGTCQSRYCSMTSCDFWDCALPSPFHHPLLSSAFLTAYHTLIIVNAGVVVKGFQSLPASARTTPHRGESHPLPAGTDSRCQTHS